MHRLSVISIFIFCLIITGCSKTVTTIPIFGTQMIVTATFRGNIDLSKNRYFMIISTNESYSFPILPPEGTSRDEFLEPGDSPVIGDKADYFTKYYSTWHSYIILDSLGYYLVRGPFAATNTSTREPISSTIPQTNYLNFTIRLDRIFGASLPDNIYFDIISVDYPAGAQKYLKDHIAPLSRNISSVSGSILSQNDEVKDDIDESLDIISWSVNIE